MNIFKKLFGKRDNLDVSKLFDNNQTRSKKISIETFSSLSSDERLGTIMSLGDTGDINYFDLLRFSIQSDPDIDVKFAALKRIHLFKTHTELVPFLESLNCDNKKAKLEPYLSMALSRVGIISQEQFEQRINNSTTEKQIANIQRWIKFDKGFSIGTKGSEGGNITEDIECIDGARVTIEKDGDIAPYSVTLGIYGLMFHTHFESSEVEARRFMEFAVKKIDETFKLYEIAENDRDTTWHDKHDQLISELAEQKNGS